MSNDDTPMVTIPHHDSTRVVFSTMLVVSMFVASCMPFLKVPGTRPNHLQVLVALPRPATMPGSSDPTGNDWPMFRGQLNHTGVATTTHVQGTGLIWSYNTHNELRYSSPAVADGCVYTGSWGCNGLSGIVYCLNATTGLSIWNYTTNDSVFSSPAVAGGRVYVGIDNDVCCLNANTGASMWNYTTGDWVWSSPAVASGRVYVGSYNGSMYCLNAITGVKIWNYTMDIPMASSPAVVGGRVYVGSGYGVYCLDATTGTLVWKTPYGNVPSSPAVVGGRLYVGIDNDVCCLNANTGASVWNYTTGNYVYCSPAVVGERVYVGDTNGNFYCLDATTGAQVWNDTAGEGWSSPAVVGGVIYVGGAKLYILNATTGNLVRSNDTGMGIVSTSPAIADGCVFVECQDGNIYCMPIIFSSSSPGTVLTFPISSGIMIAGILIPIICGFIATGVVAALSKNKRIAFSSLAKGAKNKVPSRHEHADTSYSRYLKYNAQDENKI